MDSCSNPIEVWWYRNVTSCGGESFPTPVRIPGVVFRYAVEWPSLQDCHEIALVSQKGSGAKTPATDGAALFFNSTTDSVRADDDPIELDEDDAVSFGLWVNASLFDAGRPEAKAGSLAAAYAGSELVWKFDT